MILDPKHLIHRRRWGVIFNLRALWVGAHTSSWNKRVCINLVPCLTVWFISKDGRQP